MSMNTYMTYIKDRKRGYMANYTVRKHPKLDHMSEKDRLGLEIVAERAALGEIVGD